MIKNKEEVLTKCFELANLRTLREKCKLNNKESGAQRYDSLIDYELEKLKEKLNES